MKINFSYIEENIWLFSEGYTTRRNIIYITRNKKLKSTIVRKRDFSSPVTFIKFGVMNNFRPARITCKIPFPFIFT